MSPELPKWLLWHCRWNLFGMFIWIYRTEMWQQLVPLFTYWKYVIFVNISRCDYVHEIHVQIGMHLSKKELSLCRYLISLRSLFVYLEIIILKDFIHIFVNSYNAIYLHIHMQMCTLGKNASSASLIVNHDLTFVCLFVYLGIIVPVENFSLIERRHHFRWRATNFDLSSALMVIKQWGFFSVPHLLWHGASVYNGHLRGPVTLTPKADRLASEVSLSVFTT